MSPTAYIVGMAEASIDSSQGDSQTGFECGFCDTKRPKQSVAYNWYGYPVCPDCDYQHGPRERFRRTTPENQSDQSPNEE